MTLIPRSLLFPLSAILVTTGAHATSLVTTSQNGESIEWLIANTSFTIDRVVLSIAGPDQNGGTIPAGCTDAPLTCLNEFPGGTNPVFSTVDLTPGSYGWQSEIIPLIGDPGACDPEEVVRDQQGGNQGLSGGGAQTPEEAYLECIRALGLLPPEDQELIESGSFTIEASGLIVPPTDPLPPGQGDNQSPVAQCVDVLVEGDATNCSATADINNGSFDPDGTLASITQTPPGPYGLGATNVVLTVTDDLGATASCSATVTVVDNEIPVTQCSDEIITPPDAPITFTASASDSCSTPAVAVVAYDCYRFNNNGKRIDTMDSCVITMSGANVTVEETSGVGSYIDWIVEATDSSGNMNSETCTIEVIQPGNSGK